MPVNPVSLTGAIGSSVYVGTALVADVNAAVAATADLRLMGYSCQESAGVPAAANFKVVHGATVGGGTVVAPVKLALSSSTTVWFGNDGISCPNGISIDWVAGQVDVMLFYRVSP